MYQLKKGQEAFTVVEGHLAGRSFAPGKIYDEIPPGTTGKFMEIKKAAPLKPAKVGTDLGVLGTDFKSVPKTPVKAESKKAVVAPSGTDLKSVPITEGGKS